MTDETQVPPRPPYYWQRHTDGHGEWRKGQSPPGGELAALRRGIGKEPGSVPEMWAFYACLNPDGELTHALRAEHLALGLFALHQQSKAQPMHRGGVGFGAAVRALRRSGRFSEDAVDRRFAAAATATSATELAMHLRGLVSQLRVISQPLDYTRLLADLREWHQPRGMSAVRRRWGGQYFVFAARGENAGDADRPQESDAAVPA